MTVLVGILCKDGVVIGSDSSSTFTSGPHRTIEQPVKKVHVVGDDVIIAGTGQVGLGQRFQAIVAAERPAFQFHKKSAVEIVRHISGSTSNDFASTRAPHGQFGALMAFPCKDTFALCEFAITDFQPELKTQNLWYVSMGSGQPITDPFLGMFRRVFWKGGMPKVKEALFAVTWALDHTIELNPGGIKGPPQIAVLEKDSTGKLRAKILIDEELAEHIDSVRGAEEHLSKYAELMSSGSDAAQQLPAPPAP